ncbi:MAG: helix-turn-helix domain-containing protein [Candidatus Margulisiibacteriota bacterium]|jgi:hypothetical protein
MFKYYNPNLIKSYLSYSVEQICKIYANKRLHPQTIRQWVKSGKLESVSKKPILIHGTVFKEFIKTRNDNHKKQLNFNQFKCIKCKEINIPKDNKISIYRNKNGSLRAVGICPSCKHQNMRFYKKIDEQKLRGTFDIKTSDMLRLCNSSCSTSKTNPNNDNKPCLNEPNKIISKNSAFLASKTKIKPEQLSLF